MRHTTTKLPAASLGAILLAFPACYPGSISSAADLDLVITVRAPDADFAANKTYLLPDEVVKIIDDDSDLNVGDEFDEQILALVAENLEAYGYVREPDPENNEPDVAVLVSAIVVENWSYYGGYGWWSYWGSSYPYVPVYGPGWGTVYPYPVVWVPVSYEVGTILIEMLEPQEINEEEETIPVIWSAAINALLAGTNDFIASRIESNINQAFEQAPYLDLSEAGGEQP